ncbi:ATP-binding protein [Bdellovibrio sp. SKB1291214]|uniref:ATP-binding SpoIIE family protein phosphatase n=1 Tax=Bdellovibrio sp. SKB1291214 TaxID=1732569 RepID=UPI001595EECB|nr:ATP-binding SpoIIE family protein phosphatase [Bdellovibrio sp. SKB1291214]UYL07423.1 ATP-binding protein [Bdellovibrio sp. SKB1291214]
MLQQLSGSNLKRHSHNFSMTDPSQVGEVRRFVQKLSKDFDFNEVEVGRLSIIVNELGNNLVKYAPGGRLLVRAFDNQDLKQVEILSIDTGPGMDVDVVMTDGYTTGQTPGTGLGSVKRQADYFDLYSTTKGTVIVAGIFKDSSKSSFNFGVVNLPVASESVCGDDYYLNMDKDSVTALVVDGLGHGILASQAANEATALFSEIQNEPLDFILNRIHGKLKSTRGGAVFLLRWSEAGVVTFTGVGNIRTVIQKPIENKTLISQNGTAGVQIRTPKVLSEKWDGEGLLILHTDGINNRWDFSAHPGLIYRHPAVIAGIISRDFCRGTDDATVVVIGRNK